MPSSSEGDASFAVKRKLIVISDTTPRRPTKRSRTSASAPLPYIHQCTNSGASQRLHSHKKDLLGIRDSVVDSQVEFDDGGRSSGSEMSCQGLIATSAKSANKGSRKGFVHRNAFDAYFAAASKSSRTSSNVFSVLVPSLSREEHVSLQANSNASSNHVAELEQVLNGQAKLFSRYALELEDGFNLLFFGFGSKRKVLDHFARTVCAKRGHVVLINGYMPHMGIREVIASIEDIPELTDVPLPTNTAELEAQTRRIYEFFLPPALRLHHPMSKCPLFLIIHGIDSPGLRTPKAKVALSLLALSPRIHMVASIEHISAHMIWSTVEASTRKHSYSETSASSSFSIPSTRGFAWVWHDMTTMQPYGMELAQVDLTSIKGKAAKAAKPQWGMSEAAAQHILASVNIKAKRLFMLLANTLLASFEEGGVGNRGKEKELQTQTQLQCHAMTYDALFNDARRDFIATNDTSFKALLAEFRDHGLVLTLTSGGSELLWIPLTAEELRRILVDLEQ